MATDWYVRVGEVERGPVSSEALKHLALEGRVTPDTPIRKGDSGNWVPASRVKGLFPSSAASVTAHPMPAAAPPPVPKAQPIPMPQVAASMPGVDESQPPHATEAPPPGRPPMDSYQKVLLGVGAGCLALLAVSPFLNWVNILGGGMLGIEGDGKIILILCVCVGGGLVAELAINKRAVTSAIVAQALGTIACLWMVGEVWRVRAIRESPDIRDNIFGRMLATQVSPGAGLILGMLGGLGMAVVFALLTIQCLKKTRVYAFIQAGSLLLGVGIAVLLASQASLPAHQKRDTSAAADASMGPLFPTSTPRGRSSTPATAGVDEEPTGSDSPPVIEWTDAKNPIRQGSAQIRVTRVVVEKVRLKAMMGGEGESKEKLCQISLRITNTDAGRKIDYRGWQGNSFMSDARLTDNAGNRYKGVNFGFGDEIIGQVKSESIYPGKSVDELLVFEAPIDAAKSLKLELPASNLGETGEIRFSIAREMWSADGSKTQE
jgi:hypothetical protein